MSMRKKVQALFALAVFTLPLCVRGEEKPAQALFDVVLTEMGENKIQAIVAVRKIRWMGLKEAKDLVESAPKTVIDGMTKEEGESAIKALEAVKCKAEMRPSAITKLERFDVYLKAFPAERKVQVAAMVRGATGLDESAGTAMLEKLPCPIKKNVGKAEADRLKLSYTDINAEVEVKESGK